MTTWTELGPSDPDRVGAYRLRVRLGEGGMGVVYGAVDDRGRRVALKLIRPDLAGDEEFRARFRREVDACRRVRGRRVARLLGAQVDGPQPFLATEWVDGVTLLRVLRDRGPLSNDDLLGLAAGLADALCDIHAAGVIHRDLKPSNVLLTADGPVVIDFGIAASVEATTLTRTGTTMGSAGWMAPEQATGEQATSAADIFAWGAVTCFAASGTPPFGHGRPEAVLYRVVNSDPDIPPLPEPLSALVPAAMNRRASERPTPESLRSALVPTAHDNGDTAVTELLEQTWRIGPPPTRRWPTDPNAAALADPEPGDLQPSPQERPRRRQAAVVLMATMILVAGLAGGITYWASTQDSQPVEASQAVEPAPPTATPLADPAENPTTQPTEPPTTMTTAETTPPPAPTTTTAAPPVTEIRYIEPWAPDGSIRVNVTERLSGECWGGSNVSGRDDAWRCVTGRYLKDPCFGPGYGFVTEVLCPESIPDETYTLLSLTEQPPPNSGSTDRGPFVFELSNGDTCGLTQGTVPISAGVVWDIGCRNGRAGQLNTDGPRWTVLYRSDDTEEIQTVEVATAWR